MQEYYVITIFSIKYTAKIRSFLKKQFNLELFITTAQELTVTQWGQAPVCPLFCDMKIMHEFNMSQIIHPVATSRRRIHTISWNQPEFAVSLHQI
jgi:hypothetical protein